MPTTKTERHRKIEGWENICQANQSQETALRSGSHSPLLCCLSPWTTIPRLSYHFVLHGFAQWEALTENKRTDGGRKQLFLIATLLCVSSSFGKPLPLCFQLLMCGSCLDPISCPMESALPCGLNKQEAGVVVVVLGEM